MKLQIIPSFVHYSERDLEEGGGRTGGTVAKHCNKILLNQIKPYLREYRSALDYCHTLYSQGVQ